MPPFSTVLPAFAFVSLFGTTAWAATVHVDGGSTDPVQDGSVAHPYHGLTSAVAAANPGDTVMVGPGVYADALTIDKAVTIEGAPRLRTVIEAPAAWHLDASGISLRSLMFQGLGTGTAIEASRPFAVEQSQIQDFDIGLRTYGVSGNSTIRHNRIVGNTHGVVLTNSGWSNYVLVENNLIQGDHGGLGLYAYDSRFRAYQNAITEQWLGIYDILPASRNLPTSYARNNLLVADLYGIYGHNIDAGELKVWANAVEAPNLTAGITASDELWTTAGGCGVTLNQPWDHGFEPSAPCVDGGLFAGDPDGSAADIGVYGGPQGGPWWQDFACRGPHLSCPGEQMAQWVEARPLVGDAMAFFDDNAWVGYDDWSEPLQDELDERFTAAWYGIETPLVYPPPNLLDPGPTDPGFGVHGLADARALFMSNVAHSLLTELDQRVPWSLDDYDAAELALLLDARTYYLDAPWCDGGLCIPENLGLRVRSGAGFPAPGDASWEFVDGEVGLGADRVATIANAVDWSRGHMLHFAGSLGQAQFYEFYWGYAGPVPLLAVMDGTDPVGPHPAGASPDPLFAHWTAGCHGTNLLLQAALRPANIPVEYVAPHHALPHFPSEGLWLSHGDDPYTSMAKAGYPAELLLIDDATHHDWFVDAPSAGIDNVGRRVAELAAVYLPPALQQYRCNDLDGGTTKASGSVFSYLDKAYTLAELDAMGFWVAIDTEIDAAGLCTVPLPLGSG